MPQEIVEQLFVTANSRYKVFVRHKKGKSRKITAPSKEIKLIQNWILNSVLYKHDAHPSAHAYIKRKNIKLNAAPHVGRKVVIKLDLKDFFNSINSDHVYTTLKSLSYSNHEAYVYTRFMVRENLVPQGGVTSGYLSNLVFFSLDNRISNLCNGLGVRYTRYSDDLSFSTNDRQLNIKGFIRKIGKIVGSKGFQLNEKKTKVFFNGQSQKINSLVVNHALNTPKRYRDNLRLEVYNFLKEHPLKDIPGAPSALKMQMIKEGQRLIGKVNFCISINGNSNKLHRYRADLIRIKNLIQNQGSTIRS